MNDEKSAAILNLCSRISSHKTLDPLITDACLDFQNWDDLLTDAESHGIAPLLNRHLTNLQIATPDNFSYAIKLLCIRHKQANSIYHATLTQILSILRGEGIECLILKGASLCHTLYPEIGLRPMRDIDLLLEKNAARRAHVLLKREHFTEASAHSDESHFHLSPLYKTIDGMKVCIELHHGLFPKDPPYYKPLDFTELLQNRTSFYLEGHQAHTLANEEMLWHLFQHGFHNPLTYEPFRLISAADIMGLVEDKSHELDWDKIAFCYPQLLKSLPLFHYITPWSNSFLSKGIITIRDNIPAKVGKVYKGWPRREVEQNTNVSILKKIQETIYPGEWWISLYYSLNDRWFSTIWCRMVQHPLHILRWVKVYSVSVFKTKQQEPD